MSPLSDRGLTLNVFDENRITRDDFLGKVELMLDGLPEEGCDTPSVDPTFHDLKPRSSRSKVKGECGTEKVSIQRLSILFLSYLVF